jgi:DNA polymerase elongation subunit (family B)
VIIEALEQTDSMDIFLRYRDGSSQIMEKIIEGVEPYFFVRMEDIGDIMDRLDTSGLRYSVGCETGGYWAINKDDPENPIELMMITCNKTSDVRRLRDLAMESWEADIDFKDRYLIDNIPLGDMPDWYDSMVRAGGFDLEWNRDEEITAMGFTTDGEQVHQWSWHPHIEIYNSIILPYSFQFSNEKDMLIHFADYFKDLDPDIISTWSGNRADWPMIYKRYRFYDLDLDWVSAIPNRQSGMTPPMKHLPRSGVYNEGTQVVLGRLTLDLADRNHGFERVWRDSGNGQLGDRRLGSVAKVAFPDNPEWWKVDFENDPELEGKCDNHHDLWLHHFEKFKEYHRGDVLLTDRLDRAYHVGRFFMALQAVCGVSFKSVFTVSKFARGQLRRRDKFKTPTTNYNKSGDSYGGGFVSKPKGGRHANVGVFDYRAMYAEIQRNENISRETKRNGPGEDIKELANGTFWYQGETGVLPQLQMDLADARNKAKEQMKKHEPGSNGYAGFNALQLAYKRAAASCYGLMGTEGHGEADRDVAATITFMGRSLTSRLMEICGEMGYDPLAGHTDSAYIGIGDADGEVIAKELTKRIQEEFSGDRYVIEYEKLMKYWVAHDDKKNRNFGWTVWPKEGLHCTGFELKKSNVAKITKQVQEKAFIALCRDNATRKEIDDIVFGAITKARSGNLDKRLIVMRSRLGKNPESYGNQGGFQGAAKRYNQKNAAKFMAGEGVPHIYTTKGMEAFKTDEERETLSVDWTTVIAKQIIAPVALIYEAMGWEQPDASGARAKALW